MYPANGPSDIPGGFQRDPRLPPPTKPAVRHDVEVLSTWLATLHFEEYIPFFLLAGYDMPTITRMTPEDLTAIGITKPNHRRKLKAEIVKLNISDGIPEYKPDSLLEWLQLLRLEEYFDTLCKQNFSTIDKVTDLTWEDLEDIGIQKLGHQKRILLAIKRIEDINLGRRPNLYPQSTQQNRSVNSISGSTLTRPSTLSDSHPLQQCPGQEVAIATHRPKSSPSTDSIPEMKTFQQISPLREDNLFLQAVHNSAHNIHHHNGVAANSLISPTGVRSLESLSSESVISSASNTLMQSIHHTTISSSLQQNMHQVTAHQQSIYDAIAPSLQQNMLQTTAPSLPQNIRQTSAYAQHQSTLSNSTYQQNSHQTSTVTSSVLQNNYQLASPALLQQTVQQSNSAAPRSQQNSANTQNSQQAGAVPPRLQQPSATPPRLQQPSAVPPHLQQPNAVPPPQQIAMQNTQQAASTPPPSSQQNATPAAQPQATSPPRDIADLSKLGSRDWRVTDLDDHDPELECTATLNRPKGMVRLKPMAKITAKTREEIAEAIMDIPDSEFKSLINNQSRTLDGWSSLDGSPRHGPSTVPRSATLKRAPPPPPPRRSNSAKGERPLPDPTKEDDKGAAGKSEDFPPPPAPLPSAVDGKSSGDNPGPREELFNNPLFRQRRKDSSESVASVDSAGLPFANEAVGTIKQKASKPYPAIPKHPPISIQQRAPSKTKTSSTEKATPKVEHEYDRTPEAVSPGDVIDDIENMLANLSDQLDAMLDEEVQK